MITIMKNRNSANKIYTFDDYLKKQQAKDPAFKKQYEHGLKLAEIAVTIANAREKKGLTQSELAQKVKTTQQVISSIESIKSPRNITVSTLLRITAALNIHITL